jgi:hypothetical protein
VKALVLGRSDDESYVSATEIWNSSVSTGPHMLAVRLHDRHRQPGMRTLKIGHCRRVDDAQPHALAGLNRPVQFSCGRCPLIR